MTWSLVVRPEVEQDIEAAAAWYDSQQPGLGVDFIEEVSSVWNEIADNPLLQSRRHPRKDIRWRYPQRFPYRVIYEVFESINTVNVLAVLHAARNDQHWRRRI